MSDLTSNETEPSRERGACPACGQTVELRPAIGDAPWSALMKTHDTLPDRYGRIRRCDESNRMSVEWRAYIAANGERQAAHNRSVHEWAALHGMAMEPGATS